MIKTNLLAALCLLLAATGRADVGETMRATADKYKNACVNLVIVMSMTMDGESSNREVEVPGLVLDPTGLIVTPNSIIDMGDDTASITTRIVSVRIMMQDGTEYPAKVVLRDSDRNLAFVRPTQPAPFPASLDYSTAVSARLGEGLFALGDLGKIGKYASRVSSEFVAGVIEKPRTLYVLAPSAAPPFGSPVFNDKGEAIGFVTLKVSKAQSKRMSMNPYEQMLLVVVPGKDVAESALQAPQAKDVKDTPPPTPPAKPAAAKKP